MQEAVDGTKGFRVFVEPAPPSSLAAIQTAKRIARSFEVHVTPHVAFSEGIPLFEF